MIFTDGPVDSKSKATGIKGLQNQIMQLRKICNHPFTFEQVERSIDPSGQSDSTLYRVAGKFEILDRILPKLFRCGHRVRPPIPGTHSGHGADAIAGAHVLPNDGTPRLASPRSLLTFRRR